MHGEPEPMIGTDDVQSPDGAGVGRLVLARLVDHAQAHGQAALRVGYYRVGKVARDVQAVGLYVLRADEYRNFQNYFSNEIDAVCWGKNDTSRIYVYYIFVGIEEISSSVRRYCHEL